LAKARVAFWTASAGKRLNRRLMSSLLKESDRHSHPRLDAMEGLDHD
jgi:hypothetical protein